MHRFSLFLAIVALFLLPGSSPAAFGSDSVMSNRGREVLDAYRHNPTVNNVVLVQCTDGNHARVQLYHKDNATATWTRTVDEPGSIGVNGWTAEKREGDGMTPLGDYAITGAFGLKPNPGTTLDYLVVTPDTYAIDGNNEYYNRIVDANVAGTREGEEMYYYTPEYNYGFTIDFNPECTPGAGSNIFFHCTGTKPATGGCVAVDENVMRTILTAVGPGDRVCIYPLMEPAQQ